MDKFKQKIDEYGAQEFQIMFLKYRSFDAEPRRMPSTQFYCPRKRAKEDRIIEIREHQKVTKMGNELVYQKTAWIYRKE